MKIGVCFFIESNLGGAATQADDLVTAARRLGHDACLLQFTHNPRSRGQWKLSNTTMPGHQLLIGRTGIKLKSERILVTPATIKNVVKCLNSFDLLIYVGVCPHITRNFAEEDFYTCYEPIYTEPKCAKVAFFTDPFWQKLYPYANRIIGRMNIVYAFAEAYRRIVEETNLCSALSVCNFGSIMATDMAKRIKERKSKNYIVWPHQWRSWKNPELLVNMAPLLRNKVRAYSDGIEYHKIRRDYWKEWKKAVSYDHLKKEALTKEGKIEFFGTVPQKTIMQEFASCRWMVDFTGMSYRTGKPIEKFVGNYQCVNIECMMLGCVNFKFENTIAPYSQVPSDCVISLPLNTNPQDVASFINKNTGPSRYQEIASRARKWSLDNFDPERVFQKCFIKPFN